MDMSGSVGTSGGGTLALRFASSSADYAAFAALCRAYVDWCRDRYRDLPWFVDAVFDHQALDDELEALPTKYGPPGGRTMIVEDGGRVVACAAYRRRSDSVCELKRLFVTDAARGSGLGRRLTQALMGAARADGFATMQLDSADRLTEAIALYRSMGFAAIAPYHDYPEALNPHILFMGRAL